MSENRRNTVSADPAARIRELEAEVARLRGELAQQEAVNRALTAGIHDVKNLVIELGGAARLPYGRQGEGQRYDQALMERISQLYQAATESGKVRRETTA